MSATGCEGMNDRRAVREFLEKLLLKKGDGKGFSDSESLSTSGRFDSVDTLELVLFLEQNYGVDFSDHFDQDELDSVDHILELLSRTPGGRPGA